MRILLAMLVSVAVVFGQAHTCLAIYLLPDGTPCRTCPTANVVDSKSSSAFAVSGVDCRACCTIKPCEHPRDSQAKDSFAQHLPHVIGLPACSAIRIELPIMCGFVAAAYATPDQPNAPPSRSGSRAPPVSLS